jgi:signal transduction histidine kinase
VARRPGWLTTRPTMGVRVVTGLVMLALSLVAWVVPSNLDAFPPITRLAAISVGAAIAASGMAIWERRPGNAIGPLLVLGGVLWIAGRLQGVASVPVWLVANIANSASQALLLAVLVAFPSGRITSRIAWAIAVFGFVAVIGANLIVTIASETRRTPGFEGPNPLYVPGIPVALVAGLQLATYVGGFLALAWLVNRYVRASGPARRTFLPLFAAGVAIVVIVMGCQVPINAGGLSNEELYALVTIQIVSFALLPAAIAVSVLRDRMARGAVADLVVELGETPAPEHLRAALAAALHDPTLEVARWSEAGEAYLDADGRPVVLPDPGSDRRMTYLEGDRGPVAVIIHDPALSDDPGLMASVAAAMRLAVENERLTDEVRGQLAEVRASRARIVEAADAERRRVERNLHDGAQQRLVALSLALRRAQAQLADDPDDPAAATLREASEQLRDALAELRELARGIHPAILTEAGLGPALRALAAESPVPVTLELDLPDGLSSHVEAAAYFVVAEALTNVAKYAEASQVSIAAGSAGDELRVEVSDDGRGGADPATGSGLRGLDDRVAALGGRLRVRSPVGAGTRVIATLPVTPLAGTPA